MDWDPLVTAIKDACALATGLRVQDVLLETERDSFNSSKGARLRLDFDQIDLTQPEQVFVDIDGDAVEAIVTQRELGVSCRFFADDHRTPSQAGAWAHALADRLVSRMALADAVALLTPVGLVYIGGEAITPDPRQVVDAHDMSVATVRLVFRYASCELATDPPGDATKTTDFFDRVEVDGTRPRAVGFPALDGVADWRWIWAGELTDMAGGRIVALGGDATTYVPNAPFERTWALGTGTATTEILDVGQLQEVGVGVGQAIVLILRAAQPATTISIVGRIAGGVGWALEGLATGAARLSALGTGGETIATVADVLDGEYQVVVLWNGGAGLELYADAGDDSAAISGSHLAGPAAIVAGALREVTGGVTIAIAAETVTDDPEALRLAVKSATGL